MRATEHGFTLIEVLTVTVIIAIIMAIAMLSFRGAKSSTYAKEAVSAGSGLEQAVASFQGDHFNRLPNPSDATQWGPNLGPLNLLKKPYAPTLTGVQEGRIKLSTSGDCAGSVTSGPANYKGIISFCPDANGYEYGIRVAAQGNKGWADASVCWFGRTKNTPTCTK
jgi:prepilin-type N-terminal cleavage/methylation domain-containing protein